MNEYVPIWLAIVTAVLAPSLLSLLNSRNARAEKLADAEQARKDKLIEWARQDEVAARVAAATQQLTAGQSEAAMLLRQRNTAADAQAAETARLLVENNKMVATTAADTTERLVVIHTLVNSNMTAAMQDSLDSTVRELASLKELAALKKDLGKQISPDTVAAITLAEAKIAELTGALAERMKQQAMVDQQQKEQKK